MPAPTIDPTVQAAIIGIVGVAVGSCIAAVFNLLTSRATRKSEERKIIYDIDSKLAVEQWKLDVERTDAANREIKERGGIWNMPRGIESFQMPVPQIASTVKRSIAEIDSSTTPPSYWSRFKD